ncbi:YegJ family protein [Neptuniibacter sp. SY11_33]|uniref:YegJ family protein n=1 Tax=Neptuniibacter sp. SY11_33 TaxID=3398215 RepID=UPI0039F45F92
MKKSLSLIFAIFTLPVFAEEKIDDQVLLISEQDKAMNAAIASAQSQLDNFFAIVQQPPKGANGFKLKIKVSDDAGVEHLWFSPFKEIKGGYAGVLVNKPSIISSMKYGEVYAFRKNQITDWGYVQDGKQVGSFTVCAMFKTMDKSIVEQYKRDHGFDCGS